VNFINPQAKTLAHMDRLVDWNRGHKPAPVTVEWDLSNRCVLGCQDCHFAHTHTRGPWMVKDRKLPMAYDSGGDLADPSVVTRALREMSSAGVQSIVWSGGGEPTTHPQWLDMVRYADSMALQQGMYTLGGLLDEPSALVLGSLATWVVVSLDCPDAETYAAEKGVLAERFRKACDGIRYLVAAKHAAVGVSFLLHKDNWKRTREMLTLARSLGATYATFRPAIHTSPDRPSKTTDYRGWITAALPMLASVSHDTDVELDVERFIKYRDWSGHGYDACRGIRLSTTVTPDGRVWVCQQRRGVRGSEIGDLSKESFSQVWAKHPGQWTDFADCRVMCRMHLSNEILAQLAQPVAHAAFV